MRLLRKLHILLVLSLISVISCNKPTSSPPLLTDEFIHYTVNDTAYSFDKPVDIILADTLDETEHYGNGAGVTGQRIPDTPGDHLWFIYERPAGLGEDFSIYYLGVPRVASYPIFSTAPIPIKVSVTEYGNIGEYIAGSFSGTLIGPLFDNRTFNITCSFRVKRRK